MHELSLLRGVVDAILTTIDFQEKQVTKVHVTCGSRSGVVAYALETAWPVATAATPLAGAHLEIIPEQATCWCPHCQTESQIDEYYNFSCPSCGQIATDIRGGDSFQVDYVEVTDREPPAAT